MAAPSLKCMIVDDSEVDRMLMERVLAKQSRKLDLRVATSLDEARQIMREDGIRLIFLDNSLPDGNGADFLPEISDYCERNHASVIMVSDWPSPFMFAKAKARNVREIWEKREFTFEAVGRILRERMASERIPLAS